MDNAENIHNRGGPLNKIHHNWASVRIVGSSPTSRVSTTLLARNRGNAHCRIRGSRGTNRKFIAFKNSPTSLPADCCFESGLTCGMTSKINCRGSLEWCLLRGTASLKRHPLLVLVMPEECTQPWFHLLNGSMYRSSMEYRSKKWNRHLSVEIDLRQYRYRYPGIAHS